MTVCAAGRTRPRLAARRGPHDEHCPPLVARNHDRLVAAQVCALCVSIKNSHRRSARRVVTIGAHGRPGAVHARAVTLTVRELTTWDGVATLLLDGGTGERERPRVHLQAAAGGYVRLVGPRGPVVWGRVESGSYGVDIVRAAGRPLHVLPPMRADKAARAPGAAGSPAFVSWWTRHYATLLRASSSTPLARGRQHVLAPTEVVAAAVAGMTAERLVVRPERLDELRAQGDAFTLAWGFDDVGLMLVRPLSDEGDGRVKMWRKRARDGTLPPLVTWWCRGLYAHVLLDGHDRVHAALLEGVQPDVIVLADATAQAKEDVEERQRRALARAAIVETIPSTASRASAMNALLRAGWDPRAAWELATPGFPLEGGVEQWEAEVRGTALATAGSEDGTAPTER